MEKMIINQVDKPYVEALRKLIRTGAQAAPQLETSPLIDLPVVIQHSGNKATPAKRAHVLIELLRHIIDQRLEGNEAETAMVLFGFGHYAGTPIRDRYRLVAKLYNPYWTWENYRKEPLTRHLLAVYFALKREVDLATELDVSPASAASFAVDTRVSGNEVLIVQNITREAPGLIQRLLDEVAIPYRIIDLHKGERFPDPRSYAALVVLGGPDSANDTTAKMTTELKRVKQALDAGVPYLGICLGLQVATRVMGGKVVKSVKEVGLSSSDGTPYSVTLTNLALTALGRKDPLFVGLENEFRVFQLHGETVEMTSTMQLLATGRECHNQIVKLKRNAYGIQSHFELTREMLIEWLHADPDLTPLNEHTILAEFDVIRDAYTITGLSLLRNFLHIAGLL